jgi:CheY-like chemotaxis protein
LGLTLSKHLIETMGGTLDMTSVEHRGSTFWIELPLASAPQIMQPLPPPSQENGSALQTRGTVLYIEDNASNYLLLEQVLEHRPGIKLISAIQGTVGLDMARQHHTDLILLDLNLPDMHGSQVLQRLKTDEETRDIPVIIVSADATPKQIEKLHHSGALEYLTKPLDIPRLLELLDSVLPVECVNISSLD